MSGAEREDVALAVSGAEREDVALAVSGAEREEPALAVSGARGTAVFPPPGSKAELEAGRVLTPRFGPDGTVTCVTVDADGGSVLMVGHMNAEALALTIETGEGWYWSRSRGELWHKGATSGNVQKVVSLAVDCDQDALVMAVRVDGHGATCHTGRVSCFYRAVLLGQRAADGPVRLEDVGGDPRFDPAVVYGSSDGRGGERR